MIVATIALLMGMMPGDGMLWIQPRAKSFGLCVQYRLVNIGGAPIDWQAFWIQEWLDINPAVGTLEPGESVLVTPWPRAGHDAPVGMRYCLRLRNMTDCSRVISGCMCGDIDWDGDRDLADFATFAQCYGMTGPGRQCGRDSFKCSDLDDSGAVDLRDFMTFVIWYGQDSWQTRPNCGQVGGEEG